MAKPNKNALYRAKETFITTDGDVIRAGITTVRAGHQLLKGREDLFELLEADYEVEQATAAPGEKRGERKSDV